MTKLTRLVLVSASSLAIVAVAQFGVSADEPHPSQSDHESKGTQQGKADMIDAQSCGSKATGLPFKWGKTSYSNCTRSGSKGSKIYYRWTVLPGTNQYACVQGITGRGKWKSIGCGTSGTAKLPWGAVLNTPRVRVRSQVPHLAFVAWSH